MHWLWKAKHPSESHSRDRGSHCRLYPGAALFRIKYERTIKIKKATNLLYTAPTSWFQVKAASDCYTRTTLPTQLMEPNSCWPWSSLALPQTSVLHMLGQKSALVISSLNLPVFPSSLQRPLHTVFQTLHLLEVKCTCKAMTYWSLVLQERMHQRLQRKSQEGLQVGLWSPL